MGEKTFFKNCPFAPVLCFSLCGDLFFKTLRNGKPCAKQRCFVQIVRTIQSYAERVFFCSEPLIANQLWQFNHCYTIVVRHDRS